MPKLGPSAGSQPQQLLADPATPKFAANVDGDASPFAIDFDVDEADALVAQEAYPSVPDRRLLDELPPLQAGPVEVGIEPALPFLILCEPASDQRREFPCQRREENRRRNGSHRHRLSRSSAERQFGIEGSASFAFAMLGSGCHLGAHENRRSGATRGRSGPPGWTRSRWGELSARRHKKRAVWPVLEPGRSRGRGRYLSWAMAVRFGETMRRVAPATEDTVAGRVAFTRTTPA
jgi:hypothetical protein